MKKRTAFGTAKTRALEQNRPFSARMMSSQSVTVTDGTSKLAYASVIGAYSSILDFKSTKPNTILISHHSCCPPYAMSMVVHILAKLWLNAHKAYSIRLIFHKVVQRRAYGCGGNFINFIVNLLVKEF